MRTLLAFCLVVVVTYLGGTKRVNSAPARQQVATGDSVPLLSQTLSLQVMLDRLGFSTGEIDGKAGPNVTRALNAFQRTQRLPNTVVSGFSRTLVESGRPDDATWQRLAELTGDAPPLIQYQITADDVAGPFTPDIPGDLLAQSKLDALLYRTPLEALAERFHASPQLLQQLNPDATFTTADERIVVPNVTVPAAVDGATVPKDGIIVVTRATSALTVEDPQGQVLFHAPVSTGSKQDPLPVGTWKVTGIQRDPVFHYNPKLFWDADPKHSKARIPAGPNSPVGVAWIDLTKPHYGIHGTPEPSQIAGAQSHGCVRLTNWDVQRVLEWARAGTRVVFR